MPSELQGRNGSGEFARRSMKNLDFVVKEHKRADVHPVTQTVGALLGIVVFPWERKALSAVKKTRLAVLTDRGWPTWQMSGPMFDENKVKTIGHLIEQIRHSVAHGKVSFDSDSKDLKKVTVTFRSYSKGGCKKRWQGVIRADELADFCRRFSECITDRVS